MKKLLTVLALAASIAACRSTVGVKDSSDESKAECSTCPMSTEECQTNAGDCDQAKECSGETKVCPVTGQDPALVAQVFVATGTRGPGGSRVLGFHGELGPAQERQAPGWEQSREKSDGCHADDCSPDRQVELERGQNSPQG